MRVRGGVAERLNALVLKTSRGESLSGVRIPPPPPHSPQSHPTVTSSPQSAGQLGKQTRATQIGQIGISSYKPPTGEIPISGAAVVRTWPDRQCQIRSQLL